MCMEAGLACLNIINNKPFTLIPCIHVINKMRKHHHDHEKGPKSNMIFLNLFSRFHPYVLSINKRFQNVMKGSFSYSVRAILFVKMKVK